MFTVNGAYIKRSACSSTVDKSYLFINLNLVEKSETFYRIGFAEKFGEIVSLGNLAEASQN